MSNCASHLHIARIGGKGLMYFDDSNVPKCSSHLCCTGYNFASHSLLTSSLHIHTVTLKYVCASAASYPNNVYDYPSFIRYCTGSQTIVACLVPPSLCSHLRRVYMCMLIIAHVFASDLPSYKLLDGSRILWRRYIGIFFTLGNIVR